MKKFSCLFIFGFALLSCNNQTQIPDVIEDTIVTSIIDSSYCSCAELIFDEPYNHFFRYERREGYTGKCQEFHENGKLKMEKNFVDGKLHGKFLIYYNNGQIEEEKEFDTNFQNGEQITYSKKGVVIFHALYKRGKQTDMLITRPDIPKIDPWDTN